MLAKRIIPCLDIKDGQTVKGTNFVNLRQAGDPVELARAYSEQGADELVFLDITASFEGRKTFAELVKRIAANISIPFTVGGGINELSDVDRLLNAGADKISINSSAIRRPELIDEIAKNFGSQVCVLAVDAKQTEKGWWCYLNGGREETHKGKTYVGDYDYLMLESQGNPKFYSYKCSKQEGYPHLYSPVISRLGELYLIRAEASAKLGNYTKALADLNTVRTRSLPNAGYKSLDATNAHELIMKERQLELAYEADRGFDVYRVGDTMKRHYPGFHDGVPEYPATSPLAIQYIPQSEINAYPGTLTQNP